MAISTNLFSYYNFDGNLADSLGNYDGTGVNPANITYPASMTGFGQCMDLTPNSYSNIGSVSQWGSNSFSISCWINSNVNPSGAYYSVFTADNAGSIGFALFTHPGTSGRLRLEIGTNGVDWRNVYSTNPLSLGTWYHVVIVVDRSTNSAQMYIDGVLQSYVGDTGTAAGSLSVVGTIPTKANYWGASDSATLTYWDGKIDDGVLWNRALTSAEVTSIYTAGAAGNPFSTLIPLDTSLQAYYECNDASDTLGNHPATFNSGVTIGAGTGKFGDSWDFATTASYVSLATPTPNASSFTAMAWGFNLRPDSAYRTLFYNGVGGLPGGMHFITEITSALAGTWSNSAFTSTGTVLASASYTGWHHYAVVGIGGTFTLYVDGVSIGSVTPTWPGTFAIAEIGGDSFGEGFAERLDDVAIWNRSLSSSEITQVYSAAGALSTLIPIGVLKGVWGSIVHNAPPDVLVLEGAFGSLVHSAPPATALLEGAWGSLVHRADPDVAVIEGMFGSLTHTVPSPTAICPNITGNPGVPATFDGSASLLPSYYHWSWVSVPGGSTIANAPVPLPDGGVTTPVDMTNNVGLWHFETINSISTPTGSIGLIDTYGDGWHGNNFVSVSVGGVAVLTNITLPSGAGPLWFNFAASLGVGVSVSFTGGTYPTECKYDLNDAPNGTGTTFYNSPTNPTVTYNFTAGSYSSLTTFSTPDTSGGGRTLAVNGATQVAGYVGTYALRFDGTNDYLDYTSTDVFPGTTNAISIAFWQNGTVGLANNSILRANDASGNRVFNIHMPFSGSIYWDCGNSGTSSYDRINKAAVAGDYSGSWNHWVFTKNVTSGEMKIYLNGVLWHSGSGLTRTLSAITNFYVGCESPSTLLYDGDLDELAVWAREISAAEVANIYALQSGSLAGGSPTLTFTPDIVGIYTINLAINATDNVNAIATIATPTPGGGGAGGQGQSLQGINLEGMLLQGVILQGD